MRRLARALLIPALAAPAAGCSYTFQVLAEVQDGRLAFVLAPGSRLHGDKCVKSVHVAAAASTSNAGRGMPVWSVSDSTAGAERCPFRLPLVYGARSASPTQVVDTPAQPLMRGVVYEISLRASNSGSGGGAFLITPDGRVRNVGDRSEEALPAS